MTSPTGSPSRLRRDRLAFAAVVAVSAVVLLAPSGGGLPLFRYADKLTHLVIFAALAWSGRRAGLPERPLGAALVAYAATSELAQAVFLPKRSGGLGDFGADVVGVGLGLLAARWQRGSARRGSDPDDTTPTGASAADTMGP